jgi:hypothetical protein
MRGSVLVMLAGLLLFPLQIGSAPAQSAMPFERRWESAYSRTELAAASTRKLPTKASRQNNHRDNKENGNDDDQVDTENIFGFTTGTDVGEVGEKEIETDSTWRFRKRDGSYTAASHKIEVGYTPFRNFHFAMAAALAYHNISNVTGLDDRHHLAFEGLSFEAKFRLIERELSGFGLTFIVEPEWARIDETSGERVRKFGTEFKLAADTELVKDRVFAAFNVLYEPERVREIATGEVEKESTLGLSSALAFQVAKGVFVGAEARYLRKYEGLVLEHLVGDALFVGPTFYAKLGERFWIAAAWNVQVAGRSEENPNLRLDLDNFTRHEAKLKAGVEF